MNDTLPPYELGYRAYFDGEAVWNCPYRYASEEGKDWQAGWYEAKGKASRCPTCED